MIVAAHQPQYLPWIGYFHKMANCDAFVILDNVQYKKREFQNRNRIRTADGTAWLTVPVETKGLSDQPVKDVRIDVSRPWAADHWKSVRQHYGRAPYFIDHADFFEKVYTQPWERLAVLNMAIIEYLRQCFGIRSVLYFESALNVTGQKTDRLVSICRALGAKTYLSGTGGRTYLEENRFNDHRIAVRYQEFRPPTYRQVYPGFQPNCAAVDLLWNCGPESGNWVRGEAA